VRREIRGEKTIAPSKGAGETSSRGEDEGEAAALDFLHAGDAGVTTRERLTTEGGGGLRKESECLSVRKLG